MKNINEDNDRYFYIRFEGQKSFYTIQESKRLMKDEYHEAKRKETSKYYILMETEKTVGSDLPDFDINKEAYSAYEFKKIGYKLVNDFGLDGFTYDIERGIILYGLITGIPTIKKPDGYYDMLMKNLTYSITEVVDNGDDTATATIEMTNTDFGVAMGSVMSRALSELIGYAFLPEDQQLSDEQLEELYMQWLLEEYSSEDAISVTNTATVNMTYQDGGWKIEASDEFFDALLGGMFSAVENM